MINLYNIYTEEIFDDKYAVWKYVLRTNFKAPIIDKDLIFEYQFCTIVDLFNQKDGNRYGNFKDINDYKDFLKNQLEDYESQGPDDCYFCGYHQKLDQIELEFFMKNYPKKQKGYLYPKIYDFKTKEELPAYYILLADYNEYYEKNNLPFKGLEVPETKEEIESLLFENQYNRLILRYELDKILNFNYSFHFVYKSLQSLIISYLKNEKLDIENYQYLYKNILEVKDIGLSKFLQYIFNSFSDEIADKKICKTCEICGQFFKYKENKKYCSETCKTRAKDKRYYRKNAKKIKLKKIK